MQSLYRESTFKPEVNALNSLLFKLEKEISFFRQDLQYQDLDPFTVVYKFVYKYHYIQCVSDSL